MKRRYSKSAREWLIGLQNMKDDLRSLRPFVPIHREAELDSLLDCLNDLQNDVLAKQGRDERQVDAWLDCARAFPASLEWRPDDD